MKATDARRIVHGASGVNVIAGIWLVLAPFVLGYSGIEQAAWNDVVIGIAVFVLAITRTGSPLRYEGISWTNFVLGLWLIVAPFVLSYGELDVAYNASAAIWNDIIVGAIIVVMAAVSAVTTHKVPDLHHDPAYRYGGGDPYSDRRYDPAAGRYADRADPRYPDPAAAGEPVPGGYAGTRASARGPVTGPTTTRR